MNYVVFDDVIWREMCTRASLMFAEDGLRVYVNDGHGKDYIMQKSTWDRLLAGEKLEYAHLSSRAIKNLLPHALEDEKKTYGK